MSIPKNAALVHAFGFPMQDQIHHVLMIDEDLENVFLLLSLCVCLFDFCLILFYLILFYFILF